MNWDAVLPLAPLLVLNGIWFGLVPVFYLAVYRRGVDDAPGAKVHHGMIGRFLPAYLSWMTGPIERALVRARVSPNMLTGLSLVLSLAAGVVLALGWIGLGGWIYFVTGILDIFDGRVARSTGRVSDAGAFADSVADRVAEAAIFSGLAWYYRSTWVLALVLAAWGTSYLVSYTRARGEGLGVRGADIGRVQRPERIVFLGAGLVMSPCLGLVLPEPWRSLHVLLVLGLLLVASTSLGTAVRRFRFIYRALANLPAPAAVRPLWTWRKTKHATATAAEEPAGLASARPN